MSYRSCRSSLVREQRDCLVEAIAWFEASVVGRIVSVVVVDGLVGKRSEVCLSFDGVRRGVGSLRYRSLVFVR